VIQIGRLCNILLLVCLVLQLFTIQAVTAAEADSTLQSVTELQSQLAEIFANTDVMSGRYDQATELKIANLQIALAKAYLSIGKRTDAVNTAVQARKSLQQVYPDPYDSRLIPVYSLLVEAYESAYDVDDPTQDKSDAAHAKMYRQMIDHIHSI
jgi:hypothetical protein